MGDVQLGPVTHFSPAEVQNLWTSNGGDPSKAALAAAVVFGAENPGGNAGIVNDTPSTGDYSIGLWQINYAGGLLATRSAQFGSPEAFAADPNAQARAAISMSSNGSNWQPWGPDFGYPGYGQAVSDPLPGSKVGNWLAAHGGAGAGLSKGAVIAAVAIVGAAGLAAWALTQGHLEIPRWLDRAVGGVLGNPVSREEDGDPEPMYVQSLLFPTDRYNGPMAKAWARKHGYRTGRMEHTEQYIHLVQVDPDKYSFKVVRTIDFGKGIKAHVAR